MRVICGWGIRIRVPGGLAAPWAAWPRPIPGVPAPRRLPGCGTQPRCQEQSGCGSVSMATRHLEPAPPPRRPRWAGGEPGSPSRPSSQQSWARRPSLVEGLRERVPYFSRDEGLTCLYFPLHLGGGRQQEGSVLGPCAVFPHLPYSSQEVRNRFWSERETLMGQGRSRSEKSMLCYNDPGSSGCLKGH